MATIAAIGNDDQDVHLTGIHACIYEYVSPTTRTRYLLDPTRLAVQLFLELIDDQRQRLDLPVVVRFGED